MEKIIKIIEVHLTALGCIPYVLPEAILYIYIYIYRIQPGMKPVHPLFVFVVICIVGDYWEFSQRKTSSVT